MRKALFIDRDGTMNYQIDGQYVYIASDFMIIPGIIDIIKKFQEKGYMIIILTNQGCIDRGLCTLNDVKRLHEYMKCLLSCFDIIIDDIYICPHHPVISQCHCRKPSPYMVEKAIEKYNIDPKKSFFIGDTANDELCAINAGIEIKNIIINETNNPKLPNNLKL